MQGDRRHVLRDLLRTLVGGLASTTSTKAATHRDSRVGHQRGVVQPRCGLEPVTPVTSDSVRIDQAARIQAAYYGWVVLWGKGCHVTSARSVR